MQSARLIPVSGISNEREAEQRATSAVLAVIAVVRDLSIELFAPLGAPRAQRATVEAFTEVPYVLDKRHVRADGLIRITYGKRSWSCLVEVKTGSSCHTAAQINDYWAVARLKKLDHVLTISNEIAPNPSAHPTAGLRVQSNSKVQVSHLSWTRLLMTAVRLKQHAGVADPEQAWILGELIRYLEHPASGALAFSDMGPRWVAVRDGAKARTIDRRTDGLADVVSRWDQLLRYAALKLGAEIGNDVLQILPKTEQDPSVRVRQLVTRLIETGELSGTLRIPNTAGDLLVAADLRGQQVVASLDIAAPTNRGARARVTWLVGQLKDAPGRLVIESYRRNARYCTSSTLDEARENRVAPLGEVQGDPTRFRLVLRVPMGLGRLAGRKSPGFIDSALTLIDDFYGDVVQNLATWRPPAPKIKRLPVSDDNREGMDSQSDDSGPTTPLQSPYFQPPRQFEPTTIDGAARHSGS